MPKFCKTVQVFDKDNHGSGLSMGYTTRLYQDALEMCGRTLFGAPSPFLPIFIVFTMIMYWFFLDDWIEMISDALNGMDGAIIPALLALPVMNIFLFAGIYYTLFTPSETPIIFDRKNQKVYWVSFVGNWRRFLLLPTVLRSYDWSEVQAMHQTMTSTTGSNINRAHLLVFSVYGDNGKLKDEYYFAGMEEPVPMLWYYINGYMAGKAHPDSGELSTITGGIFGYREIVGWFLPFLDSGNFLNRLRTMPKSTILLCFFSPVVLIWVALMCVCKLLTDLTEQRLLWPESIINALGPPLQVPTTEPGWKPPKLQYRRKVLKGV